MTYPAVRVHILDPAALATSPQELMSFWPYGDVGRETLHPHRHSGSDRLFFFYLSANDLGFNLGLEFGNSLDLSLKITAKDPPYRVLPL